MDSNHDIVPTLRMFNGLMTGKAADEIEQIRRLLNEANEVVRSAFAIASREGADTNWGAYLKVCERVLIEQSEYLYHTKHLPAATCTPRTFQLCPPQTPGAAQKETKE